MSGPNSTGKHGRAVITDPGFALSSERRDRIPAARYHDTDFFALENERFGQDVKGLIANYQKLIDGYLMGVAPERLAAASSRLGGNFDGKILDFGF